MRSLVGRERCAAIGARAGGGDSNERASSGECSTGRGCRRCRPTPLRVLSAHRSASRGAAGDGHRLEAAPMRRSQAEVPSGEKNGLVAFSVPASSIGIELVEAAHVRASWRCPWRTRKTIARPSGERTAAGPASIASEPGTPMVLTTRVTGAGAVAAGGAVVAASLGRVSATPRAIAVATKQDPREHRCADRDAMPPGAVPARSGLAGGACPMRSSVMRASPMSRSRCLGSRSRQRSRSVRTAAGVPGEARRNRSAGAGRRPSCRRRPRP